MVKGMETAIPIDIPFFVLEKLPKRLKSEMKNLIHWQRLMYSSVDPSEPDAPTPDEPTHPPEDKTSDKLSPDPETFESERPPSPKKSRSREL